MPDISQLGGLQSFQPLDLENYADNRESGFQLPKKGRYTLRAPESFPDSAFGVTKAGALSVQIDPTIVGPTNEGFVVRYNRISAATWQRGGQPVSQIGDYLRACGIKVSIKTPQDLADAVAMTANSLYEGILDWKVYNTKTKFSVEGMENFPSDGKGGHLSFVVDPGDTDEQGEPKRLRANLYVARFIPAA